MTEFVAWRVWRGDPKGASTLVFARTRDDARRLMSDRRLKTTARRVKKWDGFSMCERVIRHDCELPDDAPPFYGDEDV